VRALHSPHWAFGSRAQNVLWHWASSKHTSLLASAPGAGVHSAGSIPAMRSSQGKAGSAAPQAELPDAVKLVPDAPSAARQPRTERSSQVVRSPKSTEMANGEQVWPRLHKAAATSLQEASSSPDRDVPPLPPIALATVAASPVLLLLPVPPPVVAPPPLLAPPVVPPLVAPLPVVLDPTASLPPVVGPTPVGPPSPVVPSGLLCSLGSDGSVDPLQATIPSQASARHAQTLLVRLPARSSIKGERRLPRKEVSALASGRAERAA
jgi:hypothetical protein